MLVIKPAQLTPDLLQLMDRIVYKDQRLLSLEYEPTSEGRASFACTIFSIWTIVCALWFEIAAGSLQ